MIKLKRGDIFCTRNPMWLGRAICWAEKIHSVDNQAEYSHAGIITSNEGHTFESLWTIRYNHLDEYKGEKVLIGRAIRPTAEQHDQAIKAVVQEHQFMMYPGWRLIFHLMGPVVAKYISSGKFPVCSELTVKKEIKTGVTAWGSRWQGQNPDHVADAIRKWDAYDIVYEGIWRKQ